MLPPGHIAAGYLAAEIVLRTFHFSLTAGQFRELVLWGTFFGFAPDLDFFLAFAKAKAFRINNDVANHRRFISHAPLFWLAASLAVYFSSRTDFAHALAILLWVCSWSHFILDSEWGIMWLWPFSKKLLPFSQSFYQKRYQNEGKPVRELGFFRYWFTLVTDYFKNPQGWIELTIVLSAIIYFLIKGI